MSDKHLKLCAWAGPLFTVLFLIGYVGVAGFLPPPSPALSAGEIAEVYQNRAVSLTLGFIIMMVGLSLLIPFSAAITARMKHMGQQSPALRLTFAFSACATIAFLYVILCAWGVASFRPDRAPEIIQAFNDFAFIMLIWPVSLIPMSYIALGISIFSDDRETPVFPRWFGFFNFWMALLAYGGALLIFFQEGPFAWDGLIAFWIPAFAFFGWYIVTSVVLIKSLNKETQANG